MYDQIDDNWWKDVIAQCIIDDCENDATYGLLCGTHAGITVNRHRDGCDCRGCKISVEPTMAPNETAGTAAILG